MITERQLTTSSSFLLKCLGLVQTLLQTGDSTESIEIIEALLETNPNHPELHKKKALALITQNKYREALLSLDIFILNAKDPQKSQGLLYKADLLYSLQQYSQSLRIYSLLLLHNPDRQEIIYRKGLCFLALSRYKQASQLFDKVLSLNPNYSQCYIMNSHSLFMQKKYQKAIKALSKVTEKIEFQNTDALYLKASCHYNLNQFSQCQKELKRLLQIDFGYIEGTILLSLTKVKIRQVNQKSIRAIRKKRQRNQKTLQF